MNTTVFDTSFGWMAAAWRKEVVLRLTFGHTNPQEAILHIAEEWVEVREPAGFMRDVVVRLQRFSAGELADDFLDVAIDTSAKTPFQRAVIHHCRRIPFGETISYAELATRAGYRNAARAVGSVMSSNRFPLIVPCHRVVSANSLGGYSAPDGLSMKRRLLAAESEYVSLHLTSNNGFTAR
jgi:methylated-DNA-[protein]-cysteine S-methyltransferase